MIALLMMIFISSNSNALTNVEQETLTPHYAFSNYFGSGLYSGSDQELAVVNLPFTYEPEQNGKFKYRFRLPVSLGFYNYDFDQIQDVEFPDSVSSLTLTTGIEFDHWVNSQLKLVPFLDLGLSVNLHMDERAVIYASGITSEYSFYAWQEKHMWLTRFQRAGYNANTAGLSDGFAAVETGLDMVLPWRFSIMNRPMYASMYAMYYWYLMDLVFDPDSIKPSHQNNAQEFGFTMGFDTPLNLFFVDVERLGLGIRKTNNLHVLRIIFNFPLD